MFHHGRLSQLEGDYRMSKAFCDLPESARIAKTRRNNELEQIAFTHKRVLL
jgi:hypothetical protein